MSSKTLTPAITRRDGRNNPVWAIEAPVDIIRMDNSLAMTEHAGVFRDTKGKEIGSIAKVIGGFVFMVHSNKRGSPILAIDCKQLVEHVFANRKAYEGAARMDPPPMKKGRATRKKGRK